MEGSSWLSLWWFTAVLPLAAYGMFPNWEGWYVIGLILALTGFFAVVLWLLLETEPPTQGCRHHIDITVKCECRCCRG